MQRLGQALAGPAVEKPLRQMTDAELRRWAETGLARSRRRRLDAELARQRRRGHLVYTLLAWLALAATFYVLLGNPIP